MLLELKVTNFAIIDSLDVHFEEGLNILSGETGAGKSVILKSLALLMGEKALADTVRAGSEQAVIEGSFDLGRRPDIPHLLEEMGIDTDEDMLIVRRLVSAQGKSRVYLNGSPVPLSTLREVVSPLITVTGHAAPLIEMTGQHDNRHLQSKSYHLDLLDKYTGAWNLRQDISASYQRLREIESEIHQIKEASRDQAQRIDFLQYQKEEIEALSPKVGEEEELTQKLNRIKNFSKLSDFVAQAESSLYSDDDSVLVRIHHTLQKVQEIKDLDPEMASKVESLAQAKTLIEDTVYELRHYGKDLDADPEELNGLEERFTALRRLQKKYGNSIEDILNALSDINRELEGLSSSDERLAQLEKEKAQLALSLKAQAEDIHRRRQKGAQLLAKAVNDELSDLNMKGVEFSVEVNWLNEITATGQSDVEFMTKASKKDAPRPLAKFASGGELSRILLSLKRVVGFSDQPHTYLFDEVDTGVSGPTAEKVGRKLKAIAHGQQVICVTHLPQVASFADAHFLIEKSPSKKGVQMKIERLDQGAQVNEIARLISGEKITKTSLEHAKQLLSESNP
jgi:DNA repair protein RecN (Recombination protein N)